MWPWSPVKKPNVISGGVGSASSSGKCEINRHLIDSISLSSYDTSIIHPPYFIKNSIDSGGEKECG